MNLKLNPNEPVDGRRTGPHIYQTDQKTDALAN